MKSSDAVDCSAKTSASATSLNIDLKSGMLVMADREALLRYGYNSGSTGVVSLAIPPGFYEVSLRIHRGSYDRLDYHICDYTYKRQIRCGGVLEVGDVLTSLGPRYHELEAEIRGGIPRQGKKRGFPAVLGFTTVVLGVVSLDLALTKMADLPSAS